MIPGVGSTPASWERLATVALFGFMGVTHFLIPAEFDAIVPPAIPEHRAVTYGTGVLEILAAVGLLVPWASRATAIALVVFLVAVYPANIYASLIGARAGGGSPWFLLIRTPMQLFLMWWLYRVWIRKEGVPA